MPGSDAFTADVLIIGGGLTGLTAAAELHRAKVSFALLEAHPERIGGRVKTMARAACGPGSKDYHFDQGAQYIGQTQTEIWRLAQEHLPHAVIDGYTARKGWPDQVTVLNGKRYVNDSESWLFGIGGIPPEMGLWTVVAVLLLIQEIEAIEQAVNVAEPWSSAFEILPLDQLTVAQWFSRPWIPQEARDLVTISVQALLSAEPTEVSALYFFWYCACSGGFLHLINDGLGGPQQFYLSTGVGALLDRIARPFRDRIHLGKPVERIAQRKASKGARYVEVTLQDGTVWKASKVIVAMSPSTAGRISYDPPLEPARQRLFESTMGRTLKCRVFYDTPWWRDSNGNKCSGYAGAANHPVLWVMDDSPPGPDNRGVYALMTFTVGAQADGLGPFPTKEAITRHVTEALAFLFNDTRALSTSPHFIDLAAATWNAAESWVGGGPNMLLEPGMLSGAGNIARLLNEPWGGVVYFASAETARKLAPTTAPTYTPSTDPTQPGVYSDHRQGLGYLDGAVISGRYVAAQVLGKLPRPPRTSPKPPTASPPVFEPPALTLDQVKQALTLLAEQLHAATRIDVQAWEASAEPWRRDPAALQIWLAQALVQALVQTGLLSPPPDPITPIWAAEMTQAAIALVGSGHAFCQQDLARSAPAEREKLKGIQELTKIVEALMRVLSVQPFSASPPATALFPRPSPQPPRARPAAPPAPRPRRFTSFQRILSRP
ncbi:flavin monoamine oxidase family protein [Chondromyces apiculatus]|uniref:Amine oxidase (Flavin-containing) n=1 Tax=Chondromyces apiculatus DSM 436 TaxID=1192034 RepID=A0A017T547_9BACT|nr:NAD(P)/FAD-dependent oxidoreductase [Chondromyces apiculatus]EYF04102.1 Amine oxidase (flavin-containing) [Chondromyces apiculatus DSM 436]